MGRRIGIIAGGSQFPMLVAKEARKRGDKIITAAIKGITSSELQKYSDEIRWFEIHELDNLISYFKEKNVIEALMAGKVQHSLIYSDFKPYSDAEKFISTLERKNTTSILNEIGRVLESNGIKIIDSTAFLQNLLPDEGILTVKKIDEETLKDIEYGWKIAKKISEMDIGQSIAVKNGAVVAVEAMEGTDMMIKRAGKIAGNGIVAIKVSRPQQDMRYDVPVLGLLTIKNLVKINASALVFEAKKTIFFSQKKAISFADQHGLSIISKK
ncbi:MAG: UDP-2,3-diacylglucosamine diphosphatase LpxI [Acidobacteriota bacterium]